MKKDGRGPASPSFFASARQPKRGVSAPNTRTTEKIRNLGPTSSAWLRGAGVNNLADLGRVGVVEAWSRCALAGHPVSLTLTYALEAALQDTDWRDLPEEDKARLRQAIRRLELDSPGS